MTPPNRNAAGNRCQRLLVLQSKLAMHYSPENTFVLIVYCMVDPVDEERKTIGDVGLLNAFLETVPQDNVVHLSDSETTKITSTIAHQTLERLLRNIPQRQDPCQVVVYYGGHGKSKGFCMDDGLCRYRDLVALMETYLRKGDSCWYLVDCCYSGNFCSFLQERVAETGQDLKGSYCCLMSTTHDEEAGGDEWCLPGAFVAAMEGRIPHQYNDSDANARDWVPTIAQAISFMADQHAVRKMDRMTAFICGSFICPTDPFPFTSGDSDSMFAIGRNLVNRLHPLLRGGSSHSMNDSLVPPRHLRVGDVVYAKWRGGRPENDSIYILPIWYRATVTAIDENNDGNDESLVHVQMEYPTPPMTWECKVKMTDVTELMTFNYRYYNDTPSGIQIAQRRMAKCGKWLDYSVPVGTRVFGLWYEDDVLYHGTIISDRDIPWKKIDKRHFEKKYSGIFGPYVIVEWTEEENWTIIPLCHVFVQENPSDTVPSVAEMRSRAKIASEQESKLSHAPMECLMRSFRSAGKSLVPAVEQLGDSTHLTCFWAEDSEWYGAKPGHLNEDDLKVLTSHLRYKEAGEYCIVRWDEDGSQSCLPKNFVRRR